TAKSTFRSKGFWTGIAVGDVDNDGDDDLYLCGFDASALYRNDAGVFSEWNGSGLDVRTAPAGRSPEWRTSAGFFDYDNDGRLDLYLTRYAEFGTHLPQLCGDKTRGEQFSCSPDVYKPQIGSLYRNLGGGRFADVTRTAGVSSASGRGLGIAFGDYNNDGWTDFALANDERPGDLFENRRGKGFVNKGVESGTAFNPNGHVHGGMGVDWGDVNGDGWLDLFVTTYQNEVKSLYIASPGGLFTDSGLSAGLAERLDRWVSFGTKFLDFDLDGQLDLGVASGHVISNTATVYPGTVYRQQLQLFRNDGGTFSEVTDRMDAGARTPIVGRALAVGDLDNRGRPDIVVTQNEGAPLILRHGDEKVGNWLSLTLEGTRSNRNGFGARVTVTAGGRKQIRDAGNSGSYAAASDARLLVGLGTESSADIEVRWPSGRKDRYAGVSGGKHWRIREGAAAPEPALASVAR
ncbi:MAG: CRTAC1 family protein, partial [Armatimonadota bacterium]